MNVLVVSGIWPPDVGGPASHAPEVASFLHARGHRVEVVTTATAAPPQEPYAVRWVDRGLPVAFPAELIQLASRHSPRIPERPLRIVAMRAARSMAALAAYARFGRPQLRR